MMHDRVSAWLESLGLGRYSEAFQHNAITRDVLPDLKESDLEALGVILGHRKTLLRAIAQLSPSAEGRGSGSLPLAVSPATPPVPPERDQAERRQLTVMFCDLVDSTALSRRVDPEDLQEVIRRFLDACSHAIGRFNGYIAKYMGDGMLVYFGYPQAHEHDAERAVHAGLAILDTVKALNHDNPHPEFGLAARIGIATGHVVVGELMGQDTAKERSVFGDTPNLAARLQALATPNQLVIDPVTKRLVGNAFDIADQGAVSLKGFDTPIQAWQVLSLRVSASRFESYRASHLTNFVGREQELALLLGRWREAVEGEGQVVLLCGEAGIGKSRVTRRLGDRLAEERYQTMQFQCSPYHTNTALYPAIMFLRQAAGLASQDSAQAQLNKLDVMARESGHREPGHGVIAGGSALDPRRAPGPAAQCVIRNTQGHDAGIPRAVSPTAGRSPPRVVHSGRCPLAGSHHAGPPDANHWPHPADARVVADHISPRLQAGVGGL